MNTALIIAGYVVIGIITSTILKITLYSGNTSEDEVGVITGGIFWPAILLTLVLVGVIFGLFYYVPMFLIKRMIKFLKWLKMEINQ